MNLHSTSAALYGRITQVRTAMRRIVAPIAAKLGLTPSQLLILAELDNGPLNISGLSCHLEMNQGNVSTHCKRMEKLGLLTRTRSAQDERVVTLTITEKGQATLQQFQIFMDAINQTLSQLPDDLTETAMAGLDALTQIFEYVAHSAEQTQDQTRT